MAKLTNKDYEELERFLTWLRRAGAEVLVPTHPYELVRFRSGGIMSTITATERGPRTYVGAAMQAWEFFTARKPYRFVEATPKPITSLKDIERTLIARDGPFCFYCGDPLYDAEGKPLEGLAAPSREHLVPRASQGPDHLANIFLACVLHNQMAESLSAPEKVLLRDRLRAEKAARGNALDARIGGGGDFGSPIRPEEKDQ